MGTVHPSRDRASRTTSDSGTEAVHTGTWATDHGHPAHVLTRTTAVHTPDRTGGRIGSTAGESADTDYAAAKAESGGYPGASSGTRASSHGAGAAGTAAAGVKTVAKTELLTCPTTERAAKSELWRIDRPGGLSHYAHPSYGERDVIGMAVRKRIRILYTSVLCKGCCC